MAGQIFASGITAITALSAMLASGRESSIIYNPIQAPSYPLAVRNPYLQTWMPGPAVADLPTSRPQFWIGNQLTWSVIVRVNGTAYNVFGVPTGVNGTSNAVVQQAEFTSTHSIFSVTAGSAMITLDFFSPVSPSNYLRQSLPFSMFLPRTKNVSY